MHVYIVNQKITVKYYLKALNANSFHGFYDQQNKYHYV